MRHHTSVGAFMKRTYQRNNLTIVSSHSSNKRIPQGLDIYLGGFKPTTNTVCSSRLENTGVSAEGDILVNSLSFSCACYQQFTAFHSTFYVMPFLHRPPNSNSFIQHGKPSVRCIKGRVSQRDLRIGL